MYLYMLHLSYIKVALVQQMNCINSEYSSNFYLVAAFFILISHIGIYLSFLHICHFVYNVHVSILLTINVIHVTNCKC